MKTKHIFLSVLIASAGFAFTACDDYLDEVPEASISPEVYFTEATHIQASADNLYSDILPLTELEIHMASTKMMQQRTIK